MKKIILLLICASNVMTSISQNVGIGTDDPQEKLDVNGGILSNAIHLKDGSEAYRILSEGELADALEQHQMVSSFTSGFPVGWQSFTSGVTGILSKIALMHNGPRVTTLSIYEGEGTGGPLLATVTFSTAGGWQDSPPLNIPIVYNYQYTIKLENSSDWKGKDSNVYPGGRSSISVNYDMTFQTFVLAPSAGFMVDTNGNTTIGGDLMIDGNVGLGTSDPTSRLHLSGVDGKIRIDGGSSSTPYFSFGGLGEFSIDAVNNPGGRFIIKNNGKIGIGTSTPVSAFHIQTNETAANSFGILASGGLAGNACIEIRGNGGIPYLDFANDSTTDFDGRLILTSDNRFTMQGVDLYVGDGPVYATAFNVISDRRLKKDIEEVHFPISEIDEMNVYEYYYTDHHPTYPLTDALQTGLMAQEVELVYPHAVTTDSEGIKAIDYGKLTPLLLDYIKQLKAENDTQKKELENLRQDHDTLKEDVEWIKKQL